MTSPPVSSFGACLCAIYFLFSFSFSEQKVKLNDILGTDLEAMLPPRARDICSRPMLFLTTVFSICGWSLKVETLLSFASLKVEARHL